MPTVLYENNNYERGTDMKLTWLGQAGYRIVTDCGTVIVIDPYMSDSLHAEKGDDYLREVPINEDILHSHIDILVFTHCHADHVDFGTLDVMLAGEPLTVLASLNSLHKIRNRYMGEHNYVMFDEGIETIINGITFRSVYAAHTDEKAIGVVVEADGKVLIHTGDTQYHRRLKNEYPENADVLLLPVNGKGCNMNIADAVRLTNELKPKRVYPMHWDMFRKFGADVNEYIRLCEGKENLEVVIPEHYAEHEI